MLPVLTLKWHRSSSRVTEVKRYGKPHSELRRNMIRSGQLRKLLVICKANPTTRHPNAIRDIRL